MLEQACDGNELSPNDMTIREMGDADTHGKLDAAMAEAYGWSCGSSGRNNDILATKIIIIPVRRPLCFRQLRYCLIYQYHRQAGGAICP